MNISPLVFLFITSAFFFFFVLRFYLPVSKNPKKCGLPPGPTPWPIIGSLLTMLRNKPHFRWVLGVAAGKDITCIRLGGVHMIVVNSPELCRELLKKHDASFASRPITMATEYSGRGFLSVVVAPWGDQWKKMRRIIASEVLSPTRLRQQEMLRVEEADLVVNFVYKQCKQQSVAKDVIINVREAVRYYTGNVIRRMIFGRRCFGEGSEPGKEEEEHVEAAFTVLSLVYAFNPSDFIPSLRWFDLDGHESIMKRAIKVINKYHDSVIEEKIKRWRDGEVSSGGGKEMEDVLDILISVKDNDGKPLLTTEEIKAQSAGAENKKVEIKQNPYCRYKAHAVALREQPQHGRVNTAMSWSHASYFDAWPRIAEYGLPVPLVLPIKAQYSPEQGEGDLECIF